MRNIMSNQPSTDFKRLDLLPPYVFSVIDQLKAEAAANGQDVIDFGMGNPDQPTPPHIVEALVEAAKEGANHRYSASKGIAPVREAICDWYKRQYNVDLDPETEAIYTIGSKEGLADLTLAVLDKGDVILAPDPAYPIHPYGPIIAGATVVNIPAGPEDDFEANLRKAIETSNPKPKMLFLNYPSNPTSECVDLAFFERIVKLAKENGIWIVHDLAYADLSFDGYKAPSILEVPGAKEIAVESYTLSKSYNMAGWRVGFMVGNPILIAALTKMKSYLDYGSFAPIQHAAVAALTGPQDCVEEIRLRYQDRRNTLCEGLSAIGWDVKKPKASMFLWAKIPKAYQSLGSMKFAEKLIKEASVAVAPGIGFGEGGEGYVRFGLIVDNDRTEKALANLKAMFIKDGLLQK